MKPIQLQVAITLDDYALGTLAEVLAQAIERRTARHMQAAMVKLGEWRSEQGKLLPPPIERIQASPLEETVVTNSIPVPPEKLVARVTVLSVAPLLGEAIRCIHDEESVSTLFV